jgi:RNA polymerase-interacting CarD/CdnL/TRCF family regulator
MEMENSRYSDGDWIVHSRYGVGRIEGTEVKHLAGAEEKYLKVKIPNGVYWMSVNKLDVSYVRPISSKSTIHRYLSVIRKKPRKLANDYRARNKYISEMLSTGSLLDQVRLMRDLNGRQKDKTLTELENETLERMKRLFIDEWVACEQIDKQLAEDRLLDALDNSLQKIT